MFFTKNRKAPPRGSISNDPQLPSGKWFWVLPAWEDRRMMGSCPEESIFQLIFTRRESVSCVRCKVPVGSLPVGHCVCCSLLPNKVNTSTTGLWLHTSTSLQQMENPLGKLLVSHKGPHLMCPKLVPSSGGEVGCSQSQWSLLFE